MAENFPDVGFMRLDVSGSYANRAIAKEKVLTHAASRREGAQPVLKGELKFPCFTLHIPPCLQPVVQLTGATALQDLVRAIPGYYSEGYHPEGSGKGRKSQTPAAATRGSVPLGTPPPSSPGAGLGPVPAAAAAAGVPSPPGVKAAPGNKVSLVKRGAADLKPVLSDARAKGEPVVVLWSDGGAGCAASRATARALAATGVPCLLADTSVSAANTTLASTMGISQFPTWDLYRSMKVAKRVVGADISRIRAALDAPAEPAAALPTALPTPAAAATAPAPAPSAGAKGDSLGQVQDPAASTAAVAVVDEGPYALPTGKFGKAGAVRVMPGGRTGHFWPKMPCLRCGCPWWLGEDWDARCARCGWDCEKDGYDDDSQPLPQFRARWESFRATIQGGRTPTWKK